MADSALDLVRSLKGPADPPTPDGLSKIDLAQQGWSNSALYMPNKAETILEWLLTRLLKDKVRDPTANPMLNFKYWSLLNEVLTSVIPAASNPLNNPARLWLVPLVNRVPIVPVLTTLLHLFSVDSYVAEEPLLSLALRSFYALWPYAAPKITLDSLLDCCGALFGYLAASSYKLLLQQTDLKSDLSKLALTVYTSYKESLGNAAHKKKICATFIQQHLRHWLDCVSSRKGTLESDETLTATFEVGVETLFNVDVLRVAHEQRVHTSLDETLGVLIVQAPETVLASIPYLFKSYIEVNKKFRNALFGQGSKNTGVTAAEQARGASIKFFATCDSLSRSVTESEAVWRTRLALLSIVNEEDLVVAGDQESMDILQPIGDLAVTSLAAASQVQDSSLTQMILDTLSILVHIDYDLVPGALTRVLPLISMSLDILPHALPYLGKVLSFHTKTRTVDVFTDACLTFLTGQSTVTHNPRIIYEISSSSAIFNHSFLDQLSKAIHGFLTPNQVPELTRSILGYLQTRIEDFEESISRASQNDDSSRKKRKRDKQTTPIDPDQAALVFALTAKIAVIALTSLPLQIVLDDVQQSVKQDIQEFYDGVIRRILKVAPKACLNDTNNVWGWQIVTSSILKFSYHLLDSQLVTDDENSSSPKLFKVLKAPEILPELRVEIYRVLLQEANSGRFSTIDIVEEIFQEFNRQVLLTLRRGMESCIVSIRTVKLLRCRWRDSCFCSIDGSPCLTSLLPQNNFGLWWS
ncbi:hypothetical protein QCA50_001601 [Cerrena zonata]|uniref:Uncharacterized protein n=1 Tax=Cerrena zonata TaxID=2478898 RepID=A0AAW0GTL0_9APHY